MTTNSDFSIIVATDLNNGIGIDGKLPWRLSNEMKYFKEITTNTQYTNKMNCCIMGRKSYFSIPKKFRPLPNRMNVILSRNEKLKSEFPDDIPNDVLVFSDLNNALNFIKTNCCNTIENIFLIGGSEIYIEGIKNDNCKKIYLTSILKSFCCDVFFPPIDESKFRLIEGKEKVAIQEENGIQYQFLVFQRG